MTGPYFVDANVFVYMSDPRDTRKQARAEQWVKSLWQSRMGRTSAQVLSEYYAVATRKLAPKVPHAQAWGYVQELMAWAPHPVDEPLMRRAREIEERFQISWWDSLVVAAAQLQDCRILLTEDLQDGMTFGTVRVRDPFLHAVGEPEAEYEVVPVAARLHRPRGRPNRTAARA
jgi:predicted nucleic acid-binding protein